MRPRAWLVIGVIAEVVVVVYAVSLIADGETAVGVALLAMVLAVVCAGLMLWRRAPTLFGAGPGMRPPAGALSAFHVWFGRADGREVAANELVPGRLVVFPGRVELAPNRAEPPGPDAVSLPVADVASVEVGEAGTAGAEMVLILTTVDTAVRVQAPRDSGMARALTDALRSP